MKHIMLVSHGPMAEGVKDSLEMIVGKQDQIHTISLKADGDNLQFEEELVAKMKTFKESVIIITDLLGGTPCNVSLKNYQQDENVTILAGMSLPMVLEVATNSTISLSDLVANSKEAVVDVKGLLETSSANQSESKKEKILANYHDYAGQANIVNARIDERLIHGQVAGIWSSSLNTQRLIVANDEAAKDRLQKSSLRMAAPSSMRLSVLSVKDAAANITAGKYGKQRLFLLFKNPKDVWRYLEAGGDLSKITVGNMSYKEGAREVTRSIKVMPDEEVIFLKIAAKGVNLTAQLVPDEQPIDFIKKMRQD